MTQSAKTFDELAEAYEAMIDWPRRLENELPLYRWLLAHYTVHRVLDAACGTAQHARMLASMGIDVEAADISQGMLDRAAQTPTPAPPAGKLRLVRRGFTDSIPSPGSFDLVMCVGNSLPLAGQRPLVAAAIANLFSAVRPGGTLLIQILNLWRLPDGPVQWSKCKLANLASGRHLLIKGIHRVADRGLVDLLITRLDGDHAILRSDCVSFPGLTADELRTSALAAGAGTVTFFGDYARNPYDPHTSQDLIMLAERPA